MLVDFGAKQTALFGDCVETCFHIKSHDFRASAVTKHVHEGVVAVEQLAFSTGHKYTFLHLRKQVLVLLFHCQVIGGIAYHVYGSSLSAALLSVGGSGDQAKATEHRIRSLEKTVVTIAAAVRASLPFAFVFAGKDGGAYPSDYIGRSHAQTLEQRAVCLHDPEFRVMH